MAEIDVFTNIIATSGDGIELNDGDYLFIAQGVQVAGAIGHMGVYSQGGENSLTIAGSVYGLGDGILIEGARDTVTILQSGSVVGVGGSTALELDGYGNIVTNNGQMVGGEGIDILGSTNQIVNAGSITAMSPPLDGLGDGIVTGGTQTTVFNSGQITASTAGIAVNDESGGNGGNNTVDNNGLILAHDTGIAMVGVDGAIDTINNSGSIDATNNGIAEFGGGTMVISNTGEIDAAVGIRFEADSGDRLTNGGTIKATTMGVQVGGPGALNLVNDGTIDGATGVQFHSLGLDDTLHNTGKIEGSAVAVREFGTAGLTVNNSGEITGNQALVFLTTSGEDLVVNTGHITAIQTAITAGNGGALSVTNSGTISGLIAIQFGTQTGHEDSLTNTGTIQSSEPGTAAIIQDGVGALSVDNEGHISGGIIFSAGNDTYDGTLGAVSGAVNANDGDDLLTGGAGADTFNGGNGNDVLIGNGGNDTLIASKGNDTLSGGAGDDALVMNNGLTTTDTIDGGDGRDVMTIAGVYAAPIVFVDGEVSNVEVIKFGGGHSFNVTTTDDMVDAGGKLTINGSSLTKTDTLVFNGSAETDGHFNIVGGLGNDTFTGGDGADTMTGNGGNDVFVYQDVSQSTGLTHDKIVGYDATAEKFDLDVTVTGINTAFSGGKLTTANFDANLTAAVTAAHLAAGHAVLFTATAGNLSGHTFLVVDANGTAGYQAGQDYVMEISAGTHLASLSTGDFI